MPGRHAALRLGATGQRHGGHGCASWSDSASAATPKRASIRAPSELCLAAFLFVIGCGTRSETPPAAQGVFHPLQHCNSVSLAGAHRQKHCGLARRVGKSKLTHDGPRTPLRPGETTARGCPPSAVGPRGLRAAAVGRGEAPPDARRAASFPSFRPRLCRLCRLCVCLLPPIVDFWVHCMDVCCSVRVPRLHTSSWTQRETAKQSQRRLGKMRRKMSSATTRGCCQCCLVLYQMYLAQCVSRLR